MMNELILSIAIPVLVIAVVATAVVLAIKAFKEKEKSVFSMKLLWISYLYIMSIIALMLMLYGGAKFTRAMFANAVSPQFSYTTYERGTPSDYDSPVIEGYEKEPYNPDADKDQRVIEVDGKKYYYSYAEYRSDIVDGLTFFFAMAIMFAIHRLLVLKADKEKDSFLKKVYDFVGLAQYGILSVVALPISVYDLIKYFVDGMNLASYSRPVPGASLAVLLFVLPAWIVFLVRMMKENK